MFTDNGCKPPSAATLYSFLSSMSERSLSQYRHTRPMTNKERGCLGLGKDANCMIESSMTNLTHLLIFNTSFLCFTTLDMYFVVIVFTFFQG